MAVKPGNAPTQPPLKYGGTDLMKDIQDLLLGI